MCTCGKSLDVDPESQETVECEACGRRLLSANIVAERDKVGDKHEVTKGEVFRWINPRGTNTYPGVAEVFYLTCGDQSKVFETELSDRKKEKAIECPSCKAKLTLPVLTPPFGTDATNTELGRGFYSFCEKCQVGMKERTRKCVQCGNGTTPDPYYSRFLRERLVFMGLSIPVSIIAWAVTQEVAWFLLIPFVPGIYYTVHYFTGLGGLEKETRKEGVVPWMLQKFSGARFMTELISFVGIIGVMVILTLTVGRFFGS